MPSMHLSANTRHGARQQRGSTRAGCGPSAARTRSARSGPASRRTRSRRRCPSPARSTCVTTSAITGLTLPGMIDEPGCRSGRRISARPVRGPLPIQRRSLAILNSDTASARSWPLRLDERVARALRGEVVACFGERQAGARRRGARSPCLAKPLRRVDAGADRGAAERERAQARQRVARAGRCRPRSARRSRRTPGRASPASRPSGACGRTSRPVANSRLLLPQRLDQTARAAGISSSVIAIAAARCTADGNTSFDDCDALT